MAGLTSAKRWHLRRVFLQKRSGYSPTEAAKELGIPRKRIVAMIEGQEIDADTSVTYRLPWLSVATLAMDKWTVTDLIEALGKEASSVVPLLLFPSKPFQVTLPLYLSRLLEYLAAKQDVTVDACLAGLLRDIVLELVEPSGPQIEKAIPGFHAAFLFPEEPEKFP
jgi:hypothetical protein